MPQCRRRRLRTRSFGGCLTCRIRKVKCGQERPVCANCDRLELTCRGYQLQLHWLLVNPAERPENGNTVLNDGNGVEIVSNARHDKMRRCLFTEKQRESMAFHMLQQFSGISLEEGLMKCNADLERLSNGSRSATIGPFGVFNVNEDMAQQGSLESEKISVNSPESPLLSWIIHASSALDAHDIIPWQGLPSHKGHDLSLETMTRLGSAGNRYEELAPQNSTELPQSSPASLNVRSCEVRNEVLFLLDHFKEHLMHLMFFIPQNNSPWSTMFLGTVSESLEKSIAISHASSASHSLLHGILAMSSYHADRIYNGPDAAINSGILDNSARIRGTKKPSSSSWYSCGAKYEALAWRGADTYLRMERRLETQGCMPIEVIMAFVNLVALGAIAGSRYPRHILLSLCQYLLNKHNISTLGFSYKRAVLKCMTIYYRVMEMTACIPSTQDREVSPTRSNIPDIDLILEELAGNFNGDEIRLGMPPPKMEFQVKERYLFCELYGFPYSLLQLIYETYILANELDDVLAQNPDLAIPSPLRTRAYDLETLVLAEGTNLRYPPSQMDAGLASLRSAISAAISNALIIYFFRRVRKTNPAILQHYVELVFKSLAEHEAIRLRCEMDSGTPMWPVFIAGCEAVGEENRKTAVAFLRKIGNCGFRTADTAEVVARELWSRRDMSKNDWGFRDVLRDLDLQLILF